MVLGFSNCISHFSVNIPFIYITSFYLSSTYSAKINSSKLTCWDLYIQCCKGLLKLPAILFSKHFTTVMEGSIDTKPLFPVPPSTRINPDASIILRHKKLPLIKLLTV